MTETNNYWTTKLNSMTETNNYWTTKLNNATNRRIEKLESEGVKINTSTHEGRKVIGYNYLELVKD